MNTLKPGDKAPDFTVNDQDGNPISLALLKGKKVILYFYPKDNTPGCTAEACSLRDGKKELERMGFVILGVSPDSEKSHRGFIEKQGLNSRYWPTPTNRSPSRTALGGLKSLWAENMKASCARRS